MKDINKVMLLDTAMQRVVTGTRLMMGEFVGAGEPAKCIEWLLEAGVGNLTLITNTAGMRGGFLKAQLFERGQVAELIATHVGTTTESGEQYLSGALKITQFYPMGTWAEKVRAGAVGIGGVLVPVGIGILDQKNLFPDLPEPKPKLQLGTREYFIEEALTAEVSIIKGWRADTFGNIEFRGNAAQSQRDLAMAGNFTIAEVNEIVEIGVIEPERIGCPGVFVDAVVQGYSLAEQHELYRRHWASLG